MNKSYILILSVLLFSSCFFKPDVRKTEVQVNNHFTLSVPTDFLAQNDMHDFASLQYAHEDEPIFMIGFTEPKNELRKLKLRFSLEDYAHFATKNLAESFAYHYVSDTVATKVNGSSCLVTYFDALHCKGSEDQDIAYEVAIFETKDYYTQLISWAPASSRDLLYTQMATVIGTFKDISTPDPADPDPAYMGNPAGSGEVN